MAKSTSQDLGQFVIFFIFLICVVGLLNWASTGIALVVGAIGIAGFGVWIVAKDQLRKK